MSRTRLPKQQHDSAELLVEKILALCEGQANDLKAFRISLLLAKLTGLLRTHFAQEDEFLYPYMERSSDVDASERARSFREEMGGLRAVYMAYVERWKDSRRIANEFEAFKPESKAVFTALGDRIHRENYDLYPLANRVAEDAIKIA